MSRCELSTSVTSYDAILVAFHVPASLRGKLNCFYSTSISLSDVCVHQSGLVNEAR